MVIIVGESASGKSTLLNQLVKANPTYKKVVTYTTRPIRKGEMNGIDYHFVTDEKFDELLKKKFFLEHAEYRGWKYGSAYEDYSNNAAAVLTPHGLRQLKMIEPNLISVYLYVDRRSRLINLLARGDDIEEAYRRNLSDVGQFDGIEDEVTAVIDNTGFHMDERQVLKCLREILMTYSPATEFEQLELPE